MRLPTVREKHRLPGAPVLVEDLLPAIVASVLMINSSLVVADWVLLSWEKNASYAPQTPLRTSVVGSPIGMGEVEATHLSKPLPLQQGKLPPLLRIAGSPFAQPCRSLAA